MLIPLGMLPPGQLTHKESLDQGPLAPYLLGKDGTGLTTTKAMEAMDIRGTCADRKCV